MTIESGASLNILISSYLVDKDDVSEPQQSYEWIVRLAKFARLWVVTRGSRLRPECGLEGHGNIRLILLESKFKFNKSSPFDQVVQPGYIEFFFAARKAIKHITKENNIHLGHHLSPFSIRYPSPFLGLNLPFIIGPLSGGMRPPPVLNELYGREQKLYLLRHLDRLRELIDIPLRKTFRQANRVVITAPYMKEIVHLAAVKKQDVIPAIGIMLPTSVSRRDSTSDIIKFIFVGRIVASKGIELIIEAASLISAQNFVIDIFGTGNLLENYQQMVSSRGLDKHIRFHGFKRFEVNSKHYQYSDVLIMPSLKEPAGITLLEGMAAGLPVICVDSGGPSHSVDHNCGIKIPLSCKKNMVNDLSKGMISLIENKALREKMGRCSRERVEKYFSWEVIIPQMVTLYREVIKDV